MAEIDGFWEIAKTFDPPGRDEPGSSGIATVARIDDEGTVWVHFDGGVDETPVRRCFASVKPGDIVPVNIQNGQATIPGNASDVPASTSTVVNLSETAARAIDDAAKAYTAATSAQTSADNAASSAQRALADAATASSAAQQAVTDAATAREAADAAKTSADDAQESADTAQIAARAAQLGLADVEKVVGTVNWIAEHAAATADTTVVEGKAYYVRDATTGRLTYTEPEAGANPAQLGLWELTEAVQQFLASHLWLDQYGLNLSVDSASGWRIHQGTVDGTEAVGLYILDPGGEIAMTLNADGETIGKDGESRVEIDYHSIKMVDIENNPFFHVQDLRDRSGTAELVETFIGDGSSSTFWLAVSAISTDYDVLVSSGSKELSAKDFDHFKFVEPPASGVVITVTYTAGGSMGKLLKAFTLGSRIDTESVGAHSYVLGSSGVASGPYSYAGGVACRAVAEGAYAHGDGTHADSAFQTVIGRFNSKDLDAAFIVGNGNRTLMEASNAFTVGWNGNVDAAGEITAQGIINANSGILADGAAIHSEIGISSGGYLNATGEITTEDKLHIEDPYGTGAYIEADASGNFTSNGPNANSLAIDGATSNLTTDGSVTADGDLTTASRVNFGDSAGAGPFAIMSANASNIYLTLFDKATDERTHQWVFDSGNGTIAQRHATNGTFGSWYTPNMESGSVSVTPVANGLVTVHVDFNRTFGVAPNVFASLYTSVAASIRDWRIGVSNVTTTGFDLNVYNAGTSTTARAVRWLAVRAA